MVHMNAWHHFVDIPGVGFTSQISSVFKTRVAYWISRLYNYCRCRRNILAMTPAIHTQKQKDRQSDCSARHWRRWRQASTISLTIRAVNLTSFPFLCTWVWFHGSSRSLCVPSNLWYDLHQRTKLNLFSSRPAHDEVIKWELFPRYLPFVRGIHRSPVNSPHKGQWRGALMFSLICACINDWVNNSEVGDLRRYRTHYDVTVVSCLCPIHWSQGAVSIRKTVLPGMAIPMLKIRRPNGRLIFNMEIAIRR